MNCEINEHEVPDYEIMRGGPMNFGQPVAADLEPLRYKLSVPRAEYVRVIGPYYRKRIEDEVEDTPFHQYGEFPVMDRWRELGFPSIEWLLEEQPAIAAELVKDWFHQDVLDLLLHPDESRARYVIANIDDVSFEPEVVHIAGEAYLLKRS